MKRQGVFFIFLFSYHITQAAVIKGNLSQYAGETLNIFLFEDYFVVDEARKAIYSKFIISNQAEISPNF